MEKWKLVFFLVILIFSKESISQTYSIIPDDTVQQSGVMEDMETLIISQLNSSSDTITFKWKKVNESIPANWEASICDNQVCYANLADSGTMIPVIPSEMGTMILHIAAHVNYGTAVIRYAVWDNNYPLLKDTITFIMSVLNQEISEHDGNREFSIFPNPVTNYLHVSSNTIKAYSISITDLSGKEIYFGKSSESKTINTTFFPKGIYSVNLKTNNQYYLHKFIKQ